MLLTVVGAGLALTGPGRGKGRTSLFILALLAVSAAAGFTQRDLYPFTAWNLAAERFGGTRTAVRLVAVDDLGVEHVVDARAWEPLSADDLHVWAQYVFSQLGPREQDRAAAFLLGRADSARARAAMGARIGRYDRLLGPFAAPLTSLHPRVWRGDSVPARPFVRLRVYRERWSLERRARKPGAVQRSLTYEYRRP